MRTITTWSGLKAEIETGSASSVARALADRLSDFADQPLSELCQVLVADNTDRLSDLERTLRQPLHPPPWEYVTVTDGWYELVLVSSDDGYGFVVLVPDQPDTTGDLLAYCRSLTT